MSVVLNSIVAMGLPALLVGLLWLVGWRFRAAFPFLSASAVGGGFALLYWLILGRPDFPPIDATQWLFWFALGLIPIGWLAHIAREFRWLWGWALLIGLGIVFILLLRPLMVSEFWSLRAGVNWIVGLTLATTLLMVLTAPAGDEPGLGTPFLLATLGGLSAGALFFGKSASLGQLAGTLGGVVGIGVPLGFVLRKFTVGRGAVGMTMLLFALLWASTLGYAELKPAALAMLYLAGLSLAIPTAPFARTWKPLQRFLVPFGLVLLFGGIAFGISFATYSAGAGTYSY
ncbi:MAG: hypothetical protein SNJ72_10380 [Fimbriimonadales bacterium]